MSFQVVWVLIAVCVKLFELFGSLLALEYLIQEVFGNTHGDKGVRRRRTDRTVVGCDAGKDDRRGNNQELFSGQDDSSLIFHFFVL